MADDWYNRANYRNLDDTGFSTVGDRLFWLVARGRPSLDERREALIGVLNDVSKAAAAAHGELGGLIGNEKWEERQRIAEALSDASLTARYLVEMLSGGREGHTALEIKRPEGVRRPIDWEKRIDKYRADNRAARLVERLVRSGRQKEWAVGHVGARKGREVGRDRIYAALKRRDDARAIIPDASEAEILSLIF